MFSYIGNFINYLFNNNQNEGKDEDKEIFLAEQLLDLEIQAEKETVVDTTTPVSCAPRNAVCFQKTGLITYCGENYVLIDGMIYCDLVGCTLNINVNDKVLYLGYKDTNESIIVVRILENQGLFWGEEEESDENSFSVIEHVIIGQVGFRQERTVYITDSDLKFTLDEVQGTFVPIKGDWLELKCTVQHDEKKPADISTNQVLKVISFNPIRTKIKSAIVTEWTGTLGICDKNIYFNNSILVNGSQPALGSKVLVEIIESTQDKCTWRAIKLIVLETGFVKGSQLELLNEEQVSLNLEKEKCLEMTYPLEFQEIFMDNTEKKMLILINRSQQTYILNKWVVLSKKRDSQVTIHPIVSQPMYLNAKENITFTITCHPKFLGRSKECIVVSFKGFQLKRYIHINVVGGNDHIAYDTDRNDRRVRNFEKIEMLRKIRINNKPCIAGERLVKTPAFVSVKIGHFPIPDKIWSVILGDSEQLTHSNEFTKILSHIENRLPCLVQELSITNYIDKWHTLLYMEEIQLNINMRGYDKSKVFLTHCDEYLCIEILGLAEKRPSLIKGDRAVVNDTWNPDVPQYEGFIHSIRGNLILMKFNSQFHESYGGSDVDITFHISRTMFKRAHYAVNLALSNLGPEILFPSCLQLKSQQICTENLDKIEWFNRNLNNDQKIAVVNILKGECRPMPYIIFGPPGTGKTVTVIEVILQILRLIPESRILVATPSNSASNLITERLIHYKDMISGSIVRLIANYLIEADRVPNIIKPFCATLDVSTENTSKSKCYVKDNIRFNCSKSIIGRHRVTIGTCYCLGSLKHIDFPRGHFTHIIIDEAGQATEPEIMLPLTYTDKAHGQIILAGDPMQLGPVVVSKYCIEYGMDESFMCRILERFPYLKDYEAYANGFDKRLVTKLNDNYRSLKEVLTLPSEMFYDGSLVEKIDKSLPWISRTINATCEIFDSKSNEGGIFVYGIKGINMRAEDSPSWYNPHEALMVALTACKLYKRNMQADEIGIITPYVAQTKYLRTIFDSMGLIQPKIGTVEDFQGQERQIILISTVRSNEVILQEDAKYYIGFVNSPKRLNVALTRAQVSSIVFCNPHLLSKDPLWGKIIAHAVANEKYMGCDLPCNYN